MNLLKATERELLLRAKSYFDRIIKLEINVSGYLSGNREKENLIKEEYRKLKQEIRDEAKFFQAEKNSIMDISRTHNCYQAGIEECAAHGFETKANGKITQKMFNSLEEAEYRLAKYVTDLEEWRELQ